MRPHGRFRLVLQVCLGLTFACVQPATIAAQNAGAPVVRGVIGATVALEVTKANGSYTGTGFYVDSSGTLFTAAHVVRGALAVVAIDSGGLRTPVQGLLYADSVLDFAALKVAGTSRSFLRIADNDALEVGERILVVSSPLGLDFSVADGVLSARRTVDGRVFLQISAPVSPGSSGGPVVDASGRLVGLVVSGLRGAGAENLNFALSARNLRELLPVVRFRAVESFNSSVAAMPDPAMDLSAVNVGLKPNWERLNGTEVTSLYLRGGGYSDKTWVRYRMTRDDNGNAAFERATTGTLLFVNVSETIVSQFTTRTLIRTDTIGDFESFFADAIIARGQSAKSMASSVRSGIYRRTGNLFPTVAVRAPPGVIPPDLVMAVVATAEIPPDSLLILRTLASDSSGVRLQTTRIEFGAPTRLRVPFGNAQTKCSPRGTPNAATVPVLPVRMTSGAVSEEFFVLASPPRLRASQVICVYLPTAPGR